MAKKDKSDTVERRFTQEDGRTRIVVQCSFEHVERIARDKFEMRVPGSGETATMTMAQGPERTESTDERVMLEIEVAIRGTETQKLIISADDFQSMVEAVGKVLPSDPALMPAYLR